MEEKPKKPLVNVVKMAHMWTKRNHKKTFTHRLGGVIESPFLGLSVLVTSRNIKAKNSHQIHRIAEAVSPTNMGLGPGGVYEWHTLIIHVN